MLKHAQSNQSPAHHGPNLRFFEMLSVEFMVFCQMTLLMWILRLKDL